MSLHKNASIQAKVQELKGKQFIAILRELLVHQSNGTTNI
jgi:hypothetical protein